MKKVIKEKTSKEGNKKSSNKPKMRLKVWVWLCFGIVFAVAFAICGFYYYRWAQDNQSIKRIEKELESIEVEELPVDTEQEEIVNPPEENTSSGPNDYWDYIKLPLISVDFTELKNKNSDTVAFLQVSGTNINYPVVQTTDNEYYLTHSFDRKVNSAGWVFSDYRNNLTNLKDNSVIYAHGRVNKTMFGSLKNILESNWYNDTENYVVHLATPEVSYLFQVISVYRIPNETYYITTNFGTKESKQKFIDTILSRSEYDFHVDVNTNDKLLTLSTCYNQGDRVVLHAKLIKKQAQ